MMTNDTTTRMQRIRTRLETALSPLECVLEDDSARHRGHARFARLLNAARPKKMAPRIAPRGVSWRISVRRPRAFSAEVDAGSAKKML